MIKTIIRIAFLSVVVLHFSCKNSNNNQINENNDVTIESKVDSLIAIMTIEEKVGQMNMYNGFWEVTGPAPTEGFKELRYEQLKKGWVGSMLNVRGVKDVKTVQKIVVEESRLGIPLIIGLDVIHGYKTLSPIPLAEAASWDLMAIEKSASIAAEQASASGINWTFAPMVDISRDPRWGRVMEGAGEDPFLASKIAYSRVKGFQGEDLSAINTIAACSKHFAAYGFIESGKEYNSADIGTSTLYNVVLPPFKATVDAGVKTFMNSFNELNGIPATADYYLQRELLKKEWNFNGYVVSDWASIRELINWGHAKDQKDAALKAVTAGSDMDMESSVYLEELVQLVKNNKVDEALINDAVKRILRVKYELGLFDDPYKYCDEQREKEVISKEEHQLAALDMAKKSIVLLKNENNLLPLKKEGQIVALIGALADDKNSSLGSWRIGSDDNTAISVLEGMKKYEGNKLLFERGPEFFEGVTEFTQEIKENTNDKTRLKEAVETAKKADVVVMVLGEHGFQSGEARSKTNLDLPQIQQELLEEVYKVNPNIVLVLNNGRPLTINWADNNIPSIVEAWQLGTQTGNAVAQVLYGDYNPSGKLPMTFPRSVGQIPIYYNYKNTGRPTDSENNVFWSHYIDEENTPLYPFGHGLSYSTFTYSNLELDKKTMSKEESIKVSINLTNTSEISGKEVVQLYIRDLVSSITRPVRELKGFELVELNAGETKTIEFKLNKDTLGYYNNSGEYVVEEGEFKVFIGGSSITSLESEFEIK